MAKTIYEKSTLALLRDAIIDLGIKPGQVITSTRIVEWFRQHYPKLQPGTIRAHLTRVSTNDQNRLHHPTGDDLLFKVDSGQYRLYEAGKDPAPITEFIKGDLDRQEKIAELIDDDDEERITGSSEFLLERDLQRYLAENLECIEAGLRLYEVDGITGFEFDAGGRRIDILAIDQMGGLVVIELKVSKGYDRVVGQLLRYANWVRQNIAETGQKVRGIIICRTISEDLRLACAGIKDVELHEYQLSVQVKRIPTIEI